MTEKEYRMHPAISRSDLWKIRTTPEKFKYEMENPEPPSPALLFGQLVHGMLLLPEEAFDEQFAAAPNVDRRTKGGKEEYAAFLSANEGKTVVPSDMYDLAVNMAEAAMNVPFVKKLLDGEHERPFFWTDGQTGEGCKCRTDCVTTVGGQLIIVDYKSTTDASADAFQRDAFRYGYDFQSAMYTDGVLHNLSNTDVLTALNAGEAPKFVFIVQEKDPPYAVNIFEADRFFVQHGYDIYRELLGTYHYCRTSGDWYGYLGRTQDINTLGLPAWMAKE